MFLKKIRAACMAPGKAIDLPKEVTMNHPTILIAEGDKGLRQHLKSRLLPKAFDLIECDEVEDILRSLQDNKVDVVISCSASRHADDVLRTTKEIRRCSPTVAIILITRYSSEETAIAALRAGVNDYLKTPFSDKEILTSIQRNLSGFFLRTCQISDSSAARRQYG